jgi:GH15 family glucan-1,4-alpha-glucosidase
MLRSLTRLCAVLSVWPAWSLPAAASHLVTGNGHGFAVVAPERGAVTSFYPHPHSFTRPDPANPLSEGIETANFIKSLSIGSGAPAAANYVNDSQVIRIDQDGGGAAIFMPFGFERPALIISSNSPSPWRVEWNHPVQKDEIVVVPSGGARVLTFEGIDEALLLIALDQIRPPPPDQPLAASASWALIPIGMDEDPAAATRDFYRWRGGRSARALLNHQLKDFEAWRAKPTVKFKSAAERHLWRQSETMLRMAQSREPNRPGRHGYGLIVAALPDVYSTPWVRDMAWATVALARMGHKAEARAALLAYFNARPTGKMRKEVNGADYQVSVVRYFGNGEEEPFFTQEGSTNIEFDDWGEVLWALGEYLKKYRDPSLLKERTVRGPLYQVARDFIVKPLLANTETYGSGRIVSADTSIWEERQKDAKHFAFSTAMAIVGLREFAENASPSGDAALKQSMQIAALQTGFESAFIRDGKLRGTLEPGIKNDIDGALLPIINFGVVRDPDVIRNVVERMEQLKVASGGYRRVRGTYTDPKIFEFWYEQQEFLFVDFHLAELYRRLGRTAEADAMLQRIVDKSAADHNIIPEMYVAVPCELFPGKIGDPTGAIPMVGYGAGAFILHLLERERQAN